MIKGNGKVFTISIELLTFHSSRSAKLKGAFSVWDNFLQLETL